MGYQARKELLLTLLHTTLEYSQKDLPSHTNIGEASNLDRILFLFRLPPLYSIRKHRDKEVTLTAPNTVTCFEHWCRRSSCMLSK
jgi:hypothetical protein